MRKLIIVIILARSSQSRQNMPGRGGGRIYITVRLLFVKWTEIPTTNLNRSICFSIHSLSIFRLSLSIL